MSAAYKNDIEIPKSIRSLCWSINGNIDLKSNAQYIIHQVLAFGDMNDIKWLFQVYDREEIKNIFLYSPTGRGLYVNTVLNFLTKFIFKDIELSEERYNKMLKKLY